MAVVIEILTFYERNAELNLRGSGSRQDTQQRKNDYYFVHALPFKLLSYTDLGATLKPMIHAAHWTLTVLFFGFLALLAVGVVLRIVGNIAYKWACRQPCPSDCHCVKCLIAKVEKRSGLRSTVLLYRRRLAQAQKER